MSVGGFVHLSSLFLWLGSNHVNTTADPSGPLIRSIALRPHVSHLSLVLAHGGLYLSRFPEFVPVRGAIPGGIAGVHDQPGMAHNPGIVVRRMIGDNDY